MLLVPPIVKLLLPGAIQAEAEDIFLISYNE